MSGLLDQLTKHLSGNALESLSQSIGTDKGQTQSAIAAALPMLLGALAKNASKPQGADALNKALERDHDGSILDNVAGAFSQTNSNTGAGILKHLFGGNQSAVASGLGKAAGLGGDQSLKMLAALAPLVLGSLGKARGASNLNAGGLTDLLSGEKKNMQGNNPALGGLLSLLDRDGDGSVIDDIAGGLLGRFGRK